MLSRSVSVIVCILFLQMTVLKCKCLCHLICACVILSVLYVCSFKLFSVWTPSLLCCSASWAKHFVLCVYVICAFMFYPFSCVLCLCLCGEVCMQCFLFLFFVMLSTCQGLQMKMTCGSMLQIWWDIPSAQKWFVVSACNLFPP